MSMIFELSEVEEKIQYTFADKGLLRQAFTHSSYSNEQKGKSNEQLEFLGDSILNFIVAEYLYKRNPEWDEGELTKARAGLVSAAPLSEVIEGMNLQSYILLGVGESRLKNHSHNISADLFEAITAAVYLDGGMEAARDFILMSLLERSGAAVREPEDSMDCKSRLMELSQKLYKTNVQYKLVEQSGPAHSPVFTVQVFVNGRPLAKASGKSKKAAEQLAAQQALDKLNSDRQREDEPSPAANEIRIQPAKPSAMAYESRQTGFTELDDAFIDIYAEDDDYGRRKGRRSGRKSPPPGKFSAGRSAKPAKPAGKPAGEQAKDRRPARAKKAGANDDRFKQQPRGDKPARKKGSSAGESAAKERGKGRQPSAPAKPAQESRAPAREEKAKAQSPKAAPVKKGFVLPRWLGKKG